MIGGTLPYMAPEHLDAFDPAGTSPPEAVDARSDLYALGLILLVMTTILNVVARLLVWRVAGPVGGES